MDAKPLEGADLLVTITSPDDVRATVVIEAKNTVEAPDVGPIVKRARRLRPEGAVLVAAPYLSPRTRDLLTEAGAGWYDHTGNLRLALDRPAVFLDRTGASRNPFTDPDDRRLRTLGGPGAARVVRALLDGEPPFGVRALAEVAEVGVATSARVLDLLQRESLVDRDELAKVTAVPKRSLVRRWTADYGLTSANGALPMVAPRGLGFVMERLSALRDRYAITAEDAARAHLPADVLAVAQSAVVIVYVDDTVRAQGALGLVPADRGANVILLAPFDDVVYRGAVEREGLRFVAASQMVADLLTAPGRAPEVAEQMMDVLAGGDPGWAR